MKRASNSLRKVIRRIKASRFDLEVETPRIEVDSDRFEDELDAEWLRDREESDYGRLDGLLDGPRRGD